MIRKETYSLDEIFPLIEDNPQKKILLGEDPIKVGTLRLFMFKVKGVRCVTCGLEGVFFSKEQHHNVKYYDLHLNLYAINSFGHDVLMTNDHIVPKSKEGKTEIDNLQPMCYHCNQRKSNKTGEEFMVFLSSKKRERESNSARKRYKKFFNET